MPQHPFCHRPQKGTIGTLLMCCHHDASTAHLLLELCAESKAVLAMDLVELNPFLDDKNVSAERAVLLIQSALGSLYCRHVSRQKTFIAYDFHVHLIL